MPVQIGADKQKHPRSVDAFCNRYGFCRTSFYNMVKRGEAPDVLKVGGLVRITEEAEAEWLRRRSAQHVPAPSNRWASKQAA
jgi:predicted DNA-binding transcriptional regulator AlpA